jgi:hydrogenase maturation protease
MSKTLVIGYGDPLRSDAGLGWKACEQLSRAVNQDEVEIVCYRKLQPELAERVAKASSVVFIDACTDGPAGEIAVVKMTATGRVPSPQTTVIDPYTLLTCAKQWYGHCPPAVMVRVTGECFGVGTQLTPEVAAILPGVVERVRAMVTMTRNESEAFATAD